MSDPISSNPTFYRVLLENDRVRVLEYVDEPGDATVAHTHPDSVMVTLSSFSRRLNSADGHINVEMAAFQARWLDAQEHRGTNTGTTGTHAIFVELKEPAPSGRASTGRMGPSDS